MTRDEEAVRHAVERMARIFSDWGLPPMAARVLFTMMAAEERTLTAAELGERLGVSPAAISGAVRLLTQMHLVVREPVPGSRRDVYRLPDDAWYELTLAKMPIFRQITDEASAAVEAVGGDDTTAGANLARMRDYFAFVERGLPRLLAEWRER
ncbi:MULTISPECIES: MarR family transcriptional regulator [unclassified Nonomuraea]|uniref:GbsR/MarR family transcriptional regulator n=1 Tax=unclassified Nonomuraea TaxID=2593643 RepID=UPI0033C3DC0D